MEMYGKILFVYESKYEKQSEEDGSKSLLSYMKYESRVEQMESAIEFILAELELNPQERIQVITERIIKAYYLLYLAYLYYWEQSSEQMRWDEVCIKLSLEANKFTDKIISGEGNNKVKSFIQDCFEAYLQKIIELDNKKNEQKNRAFVEVAKYLYQQGMEIQDISYDKIIQKIDSLKEV